MMTTSGAFIRTVIRGGSTAQRWSNEELDCYANVLRQPARARASSPAPARSSRASCQRSRAAGIAPTT
jgi:hypothetical protein